MYAIIHQYTLSCPNCRKRFATVYGFMSDIHLGPEVAHCRSCDHAFDTGWKEWPQLSKRDKRQFLFKGLWIYLVLGGFGVAWVCFHSKDFKGFNDSVTFLFFLLLGLVFLALVKVFYRLSKVPPSVNRYRNQVVPVIGPAPITLPPTLQKTFEKAAADPRWDEAYTDGSRVQKVKDSKA